MESALIDRTSPPGAAMPATPNLSGGDRAVSGKLNHRIELAVSAGIAMISAAPGAVNRSTALRYDVAVTERDTIVETMRGSVSSQGLSTFFGHHR